MDDIENNDTAPSAPTALGKWTASKALYGRWVRPGALDGQVLEHAFINPDQTSPVEAVIVACGKTESSIFLNLHFVARDGRDSELEAAMRATGLNYCGGEMALLDETRDGLRKMGMTPPEWSSACLSHTGALTTNRDIATQQFGDAMGKLANTSFLSADPAVRESIVDSMRRNLTTLRELGAGPSKIGKH